MKSDLAWGQLPSGLFGANAAWWALMILAHNLNTAMKRLVLGKDWAAKRMKALRFRPIGLPGRVVSSHARKLINCTTSNIDSPTVQAQVKERRSRCRTEHQPLSHRKINAPRTLPASLFGNPGTVLGWTPTPIFDIRSESL